MFRIGSEIVEGAPVSAVCTTVGWIKDFTVQLPIIGFVINFVNMFCTSTSKIVRTTRQVIETHDFPNFICHILMLIRENNLDASISFLIGLGNRINVMICKTVFQI